MLLLPMQLLKQAPRFAFLDHEQCCKQYYYLQRYLYFLHFCTDDGLESRILNYYQYCCLYMLVVLLFEQELRLNKFKAIRLSIQRGMVYVFVWHFFSNLSQLRLMCYFKITYHTCSKSLVHLKTIQLIKIIAKYMFFLLIPFHRCVRANDRPIKMQMNRIYRCDKYKDEKVGGSKRAGSG